MSTAEKKHPTCSMLYVAVVCLQNGGAVSCKEVSRFEALHSHSLTTKFSRVYLLSWTGTTCTTSLYIYYVFAWGVDE